MDYCLDCQGPLTWYDGDPAENYKNDYAVCEGCNSAFMPCAECEGSGIVETADPIHIEGVEYYETDCAACERGIVRA